MKKLKGVLAGVMLVLLNTLVPAQTDDIPIKVYLTNFKSEADEIVCFVPFRNRADMVVYRSKDRQDTSNKKVQSWYFTQNRLEADLVVFKVPITHSDKRTIFIHVTEDRYAN